MPRATVAMQLRRRNRFWGVTPTADAEGSVAFGCCAEDAGKKPQTQASRPAGRLAALGNGPLGFVVSHVSRSRHGTQRYRCRT